MRTTLHTWQAICWRSASDASHCPFFCTSFSGGLVLTTQFWDTYTGLESEGQLLPPKTWSYHGLWPDFCNGSYTGYCDVSRQFDLDVSPNVSSTGIPLTDYTGNVTATAVLTQFERFDLLDHMNKCVLVRAAVRLPAEYNCSGAQVLGLAKQPK